MRLALDTVWPKGPPVGHEGLENFWKFASVSYIFWTARVTTNKTCSSQKCSYNSLLIVLFKLISKITVRSFKFILMKNIFFPRGQVLSKLIPGKSSRWMVLFYWIIWLARSSTFWMLLLKLRSVLSMSLDIFYAFWSKQFNLVHSWQVYTIIDDWSLLWFHKLVFRVLPYRIWCSRFSISGFSVPDLVFCIRVSPFRI